ncbi:hypothetical protein C8A05DRAFT_39384 [Staphylotrichum tortipilum]|uniref:Uncharacterized protein n=1 Tax=Staphylotrichum tortipilum TaxID=2831512 RepID=A0AAN6RP64_9PEZI|nr:hypothetical protein C8A05DRAFT_39384 [Staphylotrichum longicolle]
MKTAFFLTVLGLAASAAANPLVERACTGAAITACQVGCKSVANNYCTKTCGGNPSCNSNCYTSRYNQCAKCCSSSCKTC